MPRCPKCRKEIDHLIYEGNEHMSATVVLSSNDTLEYINWHSYGIDEGNYKCPECDAVLFSSEEDAKAFLRNEKIWVIYEEDDDLEVLMEGSLDEIKERLISLFKEGFCDFHLIPKKEYLKRKEEISLR